MAFISDDDRQREARVGKLVSSAWHCKTHFFGDFSPIDCYMSRGSSIVALAEIKCRTCASDEYPTVFASLRKYICLQLTSMGLMVPAFYIFSFTDRALYVNINEIDTTKTVIAGRGKKRAANDVEPLIQVPVEQLSELFNGIG